MMNKKLFSSLLIGGLLFSFTGGFVSCSEDYDDDIKDLQTQIDAQRASLAEIETLLQSGVVIKDVKSDTNGIKLILSNGNEYVLTHGEDGKDGKDAAVWTIGTDGYWYLNNEKTEYKAIGIDGVDGKDGKDGVDGKDGINGTNGKDGADGKDGKDGADGKDGINGTNGKDGADGKDGKDGADGKDGENGYYYVPNTETGMFDIYQVKDGVGTFVKATEISWRAQCLSAVFTGNKLILTGIKGAENESVTLYVGTGLGSVAFIPEVYSQDFFLPTPKTEYLHINSYGKWNDIVANTQFLKAHKDIEYSNLVTLSYRLNPSDAFVENTNFAFISRNVETRAAGDNTGSSALLNLVESNIANGEANLVTRFNRVSGKGNIVALQTWVGQDFVTSDYIYVKGSTGINAYIGKTQQTTKFAKYVQRTTANGNIYNVNDVTVDGVTKEKATTLAKTLLPIEDTNGNENHSLELLMSETHNLNNYVDLFREGTSDRLTALGFDGEKFSYKFTLVEYIGKDNQTDQSVFATLDKEGNIAIAAGTSAETRTPVVRVDAYITDYNDAERLVASAYIKIKWVKEIKKDIPDDPYPTIDLGSSNHVYQTLGSTAKQIYEMPWMKVNTDLYNIAGLNATNFWNYYKAPTYTVTVNDVDKSYKPVKGVTVNSNLADAATATSALSIALDNKVLTENTYNKRGAAAEYTVTIFIESKDDYDGKGDFTLVYKFNVSENCEAFELNPNMAVGNTVTVNGAVGTNGWEMITDIAQHFKYNAAHEDIFTYYTEHKNVKAGSLKFSENMANVDMSGDYKQMWLNTAISKDVEVPVKYSVELENGEVCEYSYTVVFENPFVGTTGKTVTVSQKPGVNTAKAAPSLKVVDIHGSDIYSWVNNALALSKVATDDYRLGNNVNVKYEFKGQDYKNFVSQLDADAKFEVNPTTGEITWENKTVLPASKTFDLTVTVTFDNISEVTCTIPVTIEAK